MMKLIVIFFTLLLSTGIITAQTTAYDYSIKLGEEEKYEEALLILDSLIKSDDLWASYFIDAAHYQYQLGAYENSIQTLNLAISIMPDSVFLYTKRSSIFGTFHYFDEGIEDLTIAYEKAEGDDYLRADLIALRSGMKASIRDFKGAYSDARRALRLDSTNINALNNLAAVCDEVNKPDETLKYLEQIIAIDSTYLPAYVNLGFKYQILEQHAKAIIYFNKALEISPQEPLGFSNRSFSKLQLNDIKGALDDINRSIELFPTNAYAYKIRALIYLKQEEQVLACEDLQAALELGYQQQFGDEVDLLVAKECK